MYVVTTVDPGDPLAERATGNYTTLVYHERIDAIADAMARRAAGVATWVCELRPVAHYKGRREV